MECIGRDARSLSAEWRMQSRSMQNPFAAAPQPFRPRPTGGAIAFAAAAGAAFFF